MGSREHPTAAAVNYGRRFICFGCFSSSNVRSVIIINSVIVRRLEWRIVKERSGLRGLSGLSPSDPEMVGWKVSNRRIIRLNYCTSAKEVMFSSASLSLLVSRIKRNTTRPIFAKFDGKVAHGPRMKRLDFGGNPDHVTLGLGLRACFGVTYRTVFLRLGCGQVIQYVKCCMCFVTYDNDYLLTYLLTPQHCVCFTPRTVIKRDCSVLRRYTLYRVSF